MGPWTVGLSGYYLKQVTDDKLAPWYRNCPASGAGADVARYLQSARVCLIRVLGEPASSPNGSTRRMQRTGLAATSYGSRWSRPSHGMGPCSACAGHNGARAVPASPSEPAPVALRRDTRR
ncbi:hypothetical protein [Cupriavidus sp. CP313]